LAKHQEDRRRRSGLFNDLRRNIASGEVKKAIGIMTRKYLRLAFVSMEYLVASRFIPGTSMLIPSLIAVKKHAE